MRREQIKLLVPSRSGGARTNPFIIYRGYDTVLFRSKVQSHVTPVNPLIERDLPLNPFGLRVNDQEPMIITVRYNWG